MKVGLHDVWVYNSWSETKNYACMEVCYVEIALATESANKS
jgi:hypothetical protein